MQEDGKSFTNTYVLCIQVADKIYQNVFSRLDKTKALKIKLKGTTK